MQWLYLVLFITSLSLIIYTYFIYPIIVSLLSKLKSKPVAQFTGDEELPTLTLIVSAYNSAKTLEKKIQNCLRLYYPKGRLQIIFVSDKHSEEVQEILSRYRKQGIANLRKIKLQDDDQAFHLGGKLAQGRIIVFSQAHTDLNDMALVTLAKNFKDKSVGAVSGKHDFYESRDSHTSFSNILYSRYESTIKKAESKLASITSADSQILAVRKSLFSGIIDKKLNYEDAIIYNLVKNGHRVIYETDANAFSNVPNDIKDDFKSTRKKSEAFYRLTFSEWSNIFPPKTLYRFMFFSHRVLHLFVPFLLVILLATSFALRQNEIVLIFLIVQLSVYGFSLINWLLRKVTVFKGFTSLIMYFVFMNIALFTGFTMYLFTGIKSLFRRKKQLKEST